MRSTSRSWLAAAAVLTIAGLVGLGALGGRARAAPVAPAAPAVAAAPTPLSPRHAALDQEIRRLERHLSTLRKARSEIAAGRSEPVPIDEAARRERETQAKALREIQRYESSRTRAVAAYVEATSPGKDGATNTEKAAEARGSVEQIDRGFLAALAKIDAAGSQANDPKAKAPDDPKAKASAEPKSERRSPPGSERDAEPKKAPATADDASKKPSEDAPKRKPRPKKVADGDDEEDEDDEG